VDWTRLRVPRRARRTPFAAVALLVALLTAVRTGAAEAPLPDGASPQSVELGEVPIVTVGPLGYRPGRGLRVGDSGLTIGGFSTVKAEYTEDAAGEFAIDSLNLFLIFDRIPRFRAVAELQLKDIFVATGDQAGAQDFAFDVRRLFGDFTIVDPLHLRAGTFLTPVGYWNLILAPPLTWTTEAPLIVEEVFFQQTTTGVMLYGNTGVPGGRLGYAAFSQFLDPLADDPDLQPPTATAGARLTYEAAPNWTVGASYQAAEPADVPGWTHLGALHGLWEAERGQLLSELYIQDGSALAGGQWGTYLQGVYEIYHPFFAVGRYEYYAAPSPDPPLSLFTIGGVWKPYPFMALKVEYRFVDRPTPDAPAGAFASFTTFF
jgi:hypothetical protein